MILESAPIPPGEEPKPRFQKREEKKEVFELDLDTLSDEQLANTINKGIALLKNRQENQRKELEERHRSQLLTAMSGTAAKKRGRKPRTSGD